MDYMNERELDKLPADFDPKFGKVDPTGAPHVGGGTWAGGSGECNSFLLNFHSFNLRMIFHQVVKLQDFVLCSGPCHFSVFWDMCSNFSTPCLPSLPTYPPPL